MGFNPSGGKISNATDTGIGSHNTLGVGATQFLVYSATDALWENTPLTGLAALPTGGGVEAVSPTSGTTNSTASLSLNLANGNVFSIKLNANVTTFAVTGATTGKACSFGLYLTQDTTGSRTVTWTNANVKWAGGTAPTLSTAASAVDILVFESLDGGTTWYGSLVGASFS
jgi:hypothetical protein